MTTQGISAILLKLWRRAYLSFIHQEFLQQPFPVLHIHRFAAGKFRLDLTL